MRILLTGGTGFIGRHLWVYLGKMGHEIENISKAEFMMEDFSRLDEKPDIVIHLAWIRNRDWNATDHLEFAELSCHFMNECHDRGIRVLNIGSSSEYGVKDTFMEENMVCEPMTTYGIAKLNVTLFAKRLGYNTLRLFTPFGEGGKSFASLYKTAEKWGNPNDVRDYQSIEFVCEAINRAMCSPHLMGEIINVCNGVQITNWEIGGPSNKWLKYPQSQYEPRNWIGSPVKMERLLNMNTRSYDKLLRKIILDEKE